MKTASLKRFLPSQNILAILPPYLWLVICLLVPFFIVLKISFAESTFGIPPYSSLIDIKEGVIRLAFHLEGYILLLTDSIFVGAYLNSLKMAAVTTICCILIGYPMAYHIARSSPK